jgi:predicted DNA-binding protein (UPF0251 family)
MSKGNFPDEKMAALQATLDSINEQSAHQDRVPMEQITERALEWFDLIKSRKDDETFLKGVAMMLAAGEQLRWQDFRDNIKELDRKGRISQTKRKVSSNVTLEAIADCKKRRLTMEEAALELGTSISTIKRKLKAHGTSWCRMK